MNQYLVMHRLAQQSILTRCPRVDRILPGGCPPAIPKSCTGPPNQPKDHFGTPPISPPISLKPILAPPHFGPVHYGIYPIMDRSKMVHFGKHPILDRSIMLFTQNGTPSNFILEHFGSPNQISFWTSPFWYPPPISSNFWE